MTNPKADFEVLLESLTAKYVAEGMSERSARMKAIMSDEAQAEVFSKGLIKEDYER